MADVAETAGPGDVTSLGGCDLARIRPSREGFGRASTIPLEWLATILSTSGNAGVPKAMLHNYGNHYYNALGSNANLPLGAVALAPAGPDDGAHECCARGEHT